MERLEATRGATLYLALEDNAERLQDRMTTVLPDDIDAPDDCQIELEWPTLDAGGWDRLDTYLREHPAVVLVIIDTLQRVRPRVGRRPIYEADYEAATQLKSLADAHGVCVLVLHHDRKAEAADFVDKISGSHGLLGAADTLLVHAAQARARAPHGCTSPDATSNRPSTCSPGVTTPAGRWRKARPGCTTWPIRHGGC